MALVGLSIRVFICHCNVSPLTKVNLRLQILSARSKNNLDNQMLLLHRGPNIPHRDDMPFATTIYAAGL
jgi:hypothetical protein